jgi:DNA repair protein RadC
MGPLEKILKLQIIHVLDINLKLSIMKNAIQLSMFNVAEIKLSYQNVVSASQRPKISCSKDAYAIFKQHYNPETIQFIEEFMILLLSRSNAVIGLLPISKGGTSGTVTDCKIIMAACLMANASGFIACHNHPSGNLNPSESDSKITKKMKEAGNLMDLQLLDHLIICNEDYYSFADQGLL